MANNSKLLKEAIADAKAVRETAIANAKIALNEAFTPKLQSMLSRKIEEELEDEEDTVEEQSTSSGIGTGSGVKVADGKDEEKAETKTSSASAGTEGDDTVVDKLTENDDEEEEDVYAEMYEEDEDEEAVTEEDDVATGEDSELDAELAEIIKELEAEDEEGVVEDEEMETEPVAIEDEEEVAVTEEEEVEDEELDLEEIIKSLREEDEDEDAEVAVTEEDDVDELKDELEEAYSAIRSLKGTINEVNLLNAKLLFSNKLFRSHNLTEGQKMRVIETFDRAANVREVKLVFSTLAESLSSNATRKSPLKEGRASKASKSTRPAKAVIVEASQFNNRMKKLAGLI